MSTMKLMLLLPLATLCVPALAQETAPAQGMVVVRDVQTGQLRTPTPAEARALQPVPSAAAATLAQPSIVKGPGGRRSVRLDERHMVYSVTTRDAEGAHGAECIHGSHAAEKAVSKPVPATKQEEHRHESR
ncbi:post-PEP-CTERM-1 domain-containing protein [Massilia yuzhufengensis]|uniref:Secreted protein n=1 Tax=Massilia yuzhufengensis TaxID=1164594 RepID=A0A1I1EWD7_9BURK|nr:hypothetical protein [Massilia yuzhufengensis]SFB91002.1 hypothetical protein SAMN05216204_102257 [Massilia yuzhufengensis]